MKKNGHIKINHDLFEKLLKISLSDYERRILGAIMRKTYGWHKTEDWISLKQLHEITEINIEHCAHTLKKLKKKNIIIRELGITKINNNFNEWGVLKHAVHIQAVHEQAVPKSAITSAQIGNQPVPKQADTKYIITKDTIIKDINIPRTKKQPVALSENILAYKDVFHYSFKPAIREEIDKAIGMPGNLTLWKSILREWSLRGWNPRNVKGMLESYKNGGINGKGNKYQDNTIDYARQPHPFED